MVFSACNAAADFDMPAALRYLAQNQADAALRLRVTVGDLKLDPCSIRLVIGTLDAAGHYGSQHFSDISHIDQRPSWISQSRLSCVVNAAQTNRQQGGCVVWLRRTAQLPVGDASLSRWNLADST